MMIPISGRRCDCVCAPTGMTPSTRPMVIRPLRSLTRSTPDLIILDLGLPAGDGFVVLDRLQKDDKLSAIPVVVLTARDPQSNERRALQAGAAAFFQKPADNGELLEVIRTTLSQSGSANRLPS